MMSRTDVGTTLQQSDFMQNRELSWLTFNQRVLEESQDEQVPLFERLKFISIFTSNLDEFFMIRVGSLTDLSLVNNDSLDNKTGMSPRQQLDKIFEHVVPLYAHRDRTCRQVTVQLQHYGITHVTIDELSTDEASFISDYYHSYIHPVLSPQVVNKRLPFPYLTNKALYVACVFANKKTTFGLVPIPASLPSFITLPGDQVRYVLTEHIVHHYVKDIFFMYEVKNATIITVTRNGDFSIEDEAFDFDVDYRNQMKLALQKRARLAAVRLEVQGHINAKLLKFLLKRLHLHERQVFVSETPLVMNYIDRLLTNLPEQRQHQLCYPSFTHQYPSSLNEIQTITAQCQQRDILLFYPYHTMDPFLKLLKESASDPQVLSIKITIYRLSPNSKVAAYLCQAAENGKEVTILIELKARFDEKNNIQWAEKLEEAGCHVIYGFENFKVHTKICLITRRDHNTITYITNISTGNYNETTARQYTDLSLITAHEDIGRDAVTFFHNLLLSNLAGTYQHLLVAPFGFKNNIIGLIDEQIEQARLEQPASIIMKLNAMTEKDILNKLSKASQAGVTIHLIIRGICCLLPGVKGKTENITVRSIVGRFLEHSRVYCFGTGQAMKLYISSADLMTRNAMHRVEIACPIIDERLKDAIWKSLVIMLADNVKARELQPDGSYMPPQRQHGEPLIDSQHAYIESDPYHLNKGTVGTLHYDSYSHCQIRSSLRAGARNE